jgi:hypothetical protein
MGVTDEPTSIEEAIDAYLAARKAKETELGIEVDPTLGDQVRQAILDVS